MNEEKFKAKEKVKSYKTLVELYGKKTADNIRIAKKEKEQHRDPAKDPKPYWLPHPDGIEDPEPRTDFVLCSPLTLIKVTSAMHTVFHFRGFCYY